MPLLELSKNPWSVAWQDWVVVSGGGEAAGGGAD